MKRFLIIILFFSSVTFASGGQEGGGGGFVHDNFIKYGKEVLFYLKMTSQGRKRVFSVRSGTLIQD